jgi:hypothetical protein
MAQTFVCGVFHPHGCGVVEASWGSISNRVCNTGHVHCTPPMFERSLLFLYSARVPRGELQYTTTFSTPECARDVFRENISDLLDESQHSSTVFTLFVYILLYVCAVSPV